MYFVFFSSGPSYPRISRLAALRHFSALRPSTRLRSRGVDANGVQKIVEFAEA